MVIMDTSSHFIELVEEKMYTVKKIIPYEFTRDIIFESSKGQEITVFDDSDLIGNDDFAFLKVGQSYNIVIGILGDLAKTGTEFTVLGKRSIESISFLELADGDENIFCLEPDGQEIDDLTEKSKIRVDVERYDLLQVDNVVHGRFKLGI